MLRILFILTTTPLAFTLAASSMFLATQNWWHHAYFASQARWTWAWWPYILSQPRNPYTIGWLALSGFAGLMAALFIGRLAYLPKSSTLYGKAQWQGFWGARQAGLLFSLKPKPDAILLGKWGPFYVSSPGEAHVSLTATTGAGKGVSFVVPNALNWGGPLFCFSVKRDVLNHVAAERERMGRRVFVFDITDPNDETHCWSGLGEVRRGTPDAYDDIQRAMFTLVPQEDKGTPYWNNAARMMATGVGVILAETPGAHLSIGAILQAIARPDYDIYLRELIDTANMEGRPYPVGAVSAVLGLLDNQETDNAKGVRSTVTTALSLWQVPRINSATNTSDFDLGEIRTGDIDVFVCAQPSDIRRLRPIYGLFFNQLIHMNSRTDFQDLPGNPKVRTLCLMDERWALGSMKEFDDAVAFIRSFGFRLAVVLQTKDQMRQSLGQEGANNLFDNMDVEMIFGGSPLSMTKEYSERGGTDTVEDTGTSRPKMGWFTGNESKANKERRLVLPQEIEQLPKDRVLIKMKGQPLLNLKRIFWYKDKAFRHRVTPTPPMPKLKIEVERDARELV